MKKMHFYDYSGSCLFLEIFFFSDFLHVPSQIVFLYFLCVLLECPWNVQEVCLVGNDQTLTVLSNISRLIL